MVDTADDVVGNLAISLSCRCLDLLDRDLSRTYIVANLLLVLANSQTHLVCCYCWNCGSKMEV